MNEVAYTPPRGNGLLRRIRKNKMAYAFLLPAILLLSTIKYYPFFTSVVESLFDWNGVNINRFIGFGNYAELLGDEKIRVAFANVFKI
jgi:raffinose/stachyose/melibiose transport system permease protein